MDTTVGVREQLQREIDQRISVVAERAAKGAAPSADDVAAIERLSAVVACLPTPTVPRGKAREFVLLIAVALSLVILAMVHLRTVPAEVHIRASRVTLTFAGSRPELLLPGEHGEVLSLNAARVSGADEISPAVGGEGAVVDLKRPPSPVPDANGLPVTLQQVVLPREGALTLTVGVAYRGEARGLELIAAGDSATEAQLGEVIDAADPRGPAGRTRQAIRSITARGRQLVLQLFPVDDKNPLTILRSVDIASVQFESDSRSSLLGGSVSVRQMNDGETTLGAGDRLKLESRQPMRVRSLALVGGEITAAISVSNATTIDLGEYPRNLKPTLFDWLLFYWPAPFYGAVAALAAFWVGFRQWWRATT